MPSTVLIAPTEFLPVLKARQELGTVVSFTDGQALLALDAIMRQRPTIVALERVFAGSTRGVALINRIKADPSLICEIRIVDQNSPPLPEAHAPALDQPAVTPARPAVLTAPPAAVPTPIAPPAASATPVAPANLPAPPIAAIAPIAPALDPRGTRRAVREEIVDGVEVLLDGNPAMLIDLSLVGAQVLSPTVLRPNQRIRMALPEPTRPIRFNASVVWAMFEMPKVGPRYRAGIDFLDADAAAIGRFRDANKRQQEIDD